MVIAFELDRLWYGLLDYRLPVKRECVVIVIILPVLVDGRLRLRATFLTLEALINPNVVRLTDWDSFLQPDIVVTIKRFRFKLFLNSCGKIEILKFRWQIRFR